MSESALKNILMDRLHAAYPSGLFWRAGAGPYSRAGVADILGCVFGYFVGIEAKAPGRYPKPVQGLSPAQINFWRQCAAAGGIYIVGDNADAILKELETRLKMAPSLTRT